MMSIVSTRYGRMSVIDADNVISHALGLYGEWAMDELVLLGKIITPGMCVLDVGAFIGTHTLAFSEFTGPTGKVYSFEPRKEIHDFLSENISLNDRQNVTPLNIGLAEKEHIINLQPLDISQEINFGGLTLDTNGSALSSNNYQVRVSTIDDFHVGKIDVIKLDVEGMERKVLDGAVKTILRDRPIIFCECNSLKSGNEVLEFCQGTQYEVFGFLAAAYNPNNFNAIKENLFGAAKELALLLIPREKSLEILQKIADVNLLPINDLEDLVLPLLYKPQYPYEVLAHTAPCSLLGINFPSPAVTERDGEIASLNQAIAERGGEIASLNQAIAERGGEIANLNQAIAERDGQMDILQQQQNKLRNEIEAVRLSTSWRITRPLREVSLLRQRLTRLMRLYQNYRQIYPGFSGLKRLAFRCIDSILKGGGKGLRNKVSLHERIIHITPVSAEAVAQQCSARRIDLLYTYLEKDLILKPTIIFDHNGGGGSNIYTHELVKAIHVDGGTVLRVYCFEAVWFVQLIGNVDVTLFYTSSIEELFEIFSASRSASIVLNSLYGYPDIEVAASNIVGLARALGATLDFKMHDFNALCPSPHLSDFEGKYCGVPQDLEVCKPCLKKNLDWYHGWYPKENRPIDIAVWRKPFADLFEAATTITFFDQSSVEIVRKAFYLEDGKVKVIPHAINYFKCDNRMDVTGPLHIGILGTLSHMKGGNVVKALYDHIDEQGLEISITVVGPSLVDTPPRINVHGNYTTNDLPIIISKQGVNVILMPSIVPETFSYTISEAMKMGLPIVAFDLGAQGNRVKQYALGKVVPLGSSSKVVLAAIQLVLKAAQELNK